MAIEKRKIENLKPGKKYALNVKVKNTDLNIVSDLSDTIIFTVPTDTTIPSALTNLELFAGLENVMFVFDYSQDLDVRKYEYELYENSDMSDEDGPLTGFADANVFTVRVSNLQLEEDGGGLAPFWGRARTIDTTGNVGPWTSLVQTDPHTPLIDNQYIGSLTASKITAGTIGAHTITLNSASSIIKSSNFNGTPVGDGSYSSATTGWLINGQGKAYFYDATVVGSIDVGGFDVSSFHVNTYGDMWLGAGTFGAAPFRVSRAGVLEIGAGTGSTIGGQLIDSIAEAVIDFNGRNNRNSTAVTAPTLPSPVTVGNLVIGASYIISSPGNTNFISIGAADNNASTTFTATGVGAGTGTVLGETIDHTLNTDGSANISFEWNYTYSSADNAANNIDGFYVHMYSSTSSDPYTFGTTPNLEATYPVDYLQRALIFSGFPADKYYTFGVKAFRVVDKDIAAPGVIYSSMVKSSVTQENPYRPSTTVAFAGNVTGTVDGTAVATITTGINNFNNNNDQKTTAPATPTSVAFSTATSNTNASIDLPLSWTFTGSGDAYDVDGFIVFLRTTTVTDATSITTSDLNTNIQQVFLTAEKISHTFSGISPSAFYRAAVRAYRVVDTNVNSAGILYGPLANTTERASIPSVLGGSTGITIGNGKIFIGAGNYGNNDTGFYVDSTSQFSLGSALKWGKLTNATAMVAGKSYRIVSVGTTTFTNFGATTNTFGTVFTATGPATGNGTAALLELQIGTGTLLSDIEESVIDFNERNNRNPTTPDTPTLANTITAGSFNIGSSYKIVSLTGTSQPQWNTAAGTANIEYAIGSVFTAAEAGAGTGTVSGETIDHDNNDDGSVDISFEWNYPITIVAATSIVSGTKYQIVSPGNTSFTAIGADNNDVDTIFTATAVGTGTGTVSVYSLERDIDGFYVHIHSSSLVTAESFVVGRSYKIISLGDTNWNTAGVSGTAAIGTVFTAAGLGVGTGTVAEVYTMGTSPDLESTYPLRSEERAAIYRGLASNKFYTFGVRAFRIVDTDIDSDGIIYGDFVQSTVVEENPYRAADNVAFKGDIEGTINGEDIDLIIGYATAGNTTAGNFNTRNDRNSTTPTTPTLANTISSSNLNIGSTYKIVSLGTTNWNTAGVVGTAAIESVFTAVSVASGTGTVSGETIDHDINDDGSVDISFEWNYTVSETPSAANNIDGFAIYYYTSPTFNISAVTPSSPSAGSVTYTTLAPHGFAVGNTVVISDLVPVEYNGTFTVTAVTSTPPNTFRVANSTTATVTNAVGSVFGNTAYTIGASPSNESVYFLPREKRALILQAVPSNKFYTFGVKAYRIVDTNLELPSATVAVTSIASGTQYKIISLGDTNWNTAGVSGTAAIGTVFTAAQAGTGTGTVKLYTLATSGILYSAAVQSTVTEENPYQPSTTVAFKGDVTGTINQVDVVDITTTYNNFNSDNDRFDTIPASATGVTFTSPNANFDGSINLTMDWAYPDPIFSAGSFVAGAKYNIISLGTTTQAQWNTIAGTSLATYDKGSTFTVSSGAQVGTGTAIKHANSIDGFAIYLRAKDTILVTAITTGTVYKIVSLGNTTTAQWNTVGVSGTAVVGTVFTASSGTRVGDGRVIENTQANITDSNFNSIITSPPLASDYSITVFYLTPEKSAITFPPLASDKLYRAAIRAYRMVDTDINSTGIIYGSLVNTTADYHKGLPIIGGDTGITIGNGKIYIGIGNYNNTDTGFYVDKDSNFSLGNKLSWNGTTLTVNGGGTFTGALSAATGTFQGALSGGTISIGSGNSIFKADSNGIYLGDAIFADAEFSVSPAGYLKSTSGKIGGWTIGSVTGTANGAETVFPGSIYQWKTVAGVTTLSLMSPDGFAWFSGGLVAPTISGFSTGVTTNGGALNTMILRNIKYGGARPTDGAIGDIFLS